jgi:hypothetical protein
MGRALAREILQKILWEASTGVLRARKEYV